MSWSANPRGTVYKIGIRDLSMTTRSWHPWTCPGVAARREEVKKEIKERPAPDPGRGAVFQLEKELDGSNVLGRQALGALGGLELDARAFS